MCQAVHRAKGGNMRSTEKHTSSVLLALLLATFGSAPAFGATVVCAGTVSQLMYENGYVMLKLSSMNTPALICSLDANFEVAAGYVTSPAACKTMYAALLTAKLSSTPLSNVYF